MDHLEGTECSHFQQEGEDDRQAGTVVEIKEEAKLWSAAGAKHLAALVVPQLRE
jgi:hypothetical protein